MRKRIGILIGKALGKVLGKMGRGSSLPGHMALRVCPGLLETLKYPERIVFVTGTNGKTTAANALADIRERSGAAVVSNRGGANMLSGIATSIIMRTKGGKVSGDELILEVDEAHLSLLKGKLAPTHLVVTNLFKDQEDRHGSVGELMERMKHAIERETVLVLNGNDPSLVSLGESLKDNRKIYYGVDCGKESRLKSPCPNCFSEMEYKRHEYGSLGEFSCGCGLKTPGLDCTAREIALEKSVFKVNGVSFKALMDNTYTIYNMMAVIAVLRDIGESLADISEKFTGCKGVPGRMERVREDIGEGFLNLVKNGVGLEETMEYIRKKTEGKRHTIVYALSNEYADGKDMSWLQGIDFTCITEETAEFVCTGEQGMFLTSVLLEKGFSDKVRYVKAIESYREKTGNVYIISSYSELERMRERFC